MIAGFGGPGGRGPRGCDACRTAPRAVYCPADAAFLCGGCDVRVHTANCVASQHERVWICEACTVAPAEVACRADDAALCAACDAEVHYANPLASRSVPIIPLPLAGTPFLSPTEEEHRHVLEDEAESWLLINSKNYDNPAALFAVDQVDELLNLVGYDNNACNEIHNQEQQELNHHRASIVLETPMIDISNSKGPIKLLPCSPLPQMAPQFPKYREAKVLKYREKRKARKFEKIIRYASRKAYAEMRPRIKGRFVKRPDAEHKPLDGSYGTVPSF